MMKIHKIYVSITTYRCLIMKNNIRWLRENIRHYMLAHQVIHNISISTFKWVRGGSNIQHSMIALWWSKITSWWKYLKGILPKLVLEHLLFIKSFASLWTDKNYNWNYMLTFHYSIQQYHDETFWYSLLSLPFNGECFWMLLFIDGEYIYNVIC